jgi:hypothetical protein
MYIAGTLMAGVGSLLFIASLCNDKQSADFIAASGIWFLGSAYCFSH